MSLIRTLLAAAALSLCASPALAQATIGELSHVHGLAADPAEPGALYVATHYGLFRARPDGAVEPVSQARDDFMGFTPHPEDPSILYASGHPAGGGNLGLIVSRDGGRTWEMLSAGANGPVDFHAMDVSKADPDVMYGTYGGLQVSRDGGRTWEIVGPLPEGTIDIAAGAKDPDRVYAATERGLRVSEDGGESWAPAHLLQRPVSTVTVTDEGEVYAYMLGTGLMRAEEGEADWRTLGTLPGQDFPLHLAVGDDRLYAATREGRLLESTDGADWQPYGESR